MFSQPKERFLFMMALPTPKDIYNFIRAYVMQYIKRYKSIRSYDES